MHLVVVLLTMLVLPVASVAAQVGSDVDIVALAGKWFLFWAAGARLTLAGLRQIVAPRLTLKGIFGVEDPRAWPLVQELGFWNISVGVLCITTLLQPTWRLPLSLASGLFFALAGLKHALATERSFEGKTAMMSDLGVAIVLLGYAFTVIRSS